MKTRIVRRTEAECRAELEAIYAEFPALRDFRRVCCGGCTESDLADEHGWGTPTLVAWERVEGLRYLLGDDA